MEISKTMLNKNIVNLKMRAKNKEEAIRGMAQMLLDDGRISSLDDFVDSVYERERMETTNMDIGVAIPHSKSPTIQKTSVALVKLNEEISWEDFGEPISIIFLLAVSPKDQGVEHLEIISKIAELLIDDKFISFLKRTKNTNKLIKQINKMIGV